MLPTFPKRVGFGCKEKQHYPLKDGSASPRKNKRGRLYYTLLIKYINVNRKTQNKFKKKAKIK